MKNILILFAALILLSCAPKISTEVMMPAKSPDATKLRRVIVFPFQGNYGKNATPAVENVLSSVYISGERYFTLLDRENLNKLMKEQKFQMSAADMDTIVRFGKLIGAEGIYTGTANSKVDGNRYFEQRTRCSKSGKSCWEVKVACLRKTAELVLEPKLVNVSTSEIMYADSIMRKAEDSKCDDDSYALMSDNELKNKVFTEAIDEFRKNVAPYGLTMKLEIMTDTDGITDNEARNMLKVGVEFAEAGRIDRACDIWSHGYTANPSSLSLTYNMGLCQEVSGNFSEALGLYQKADSLTSKPNKMIGLALTRVSEMMQNSNALMEQMHP